mmetsp:Transcript_21060/g.20211  ORF Transcript_21060/g.20211 Transcript_21060/m.20211 type:complete len:112 (-) Transcript_21060:1090-1425(-)
MLSLKVLLLVDFVDGLQSSHVVVLGILSIVGSYLVGRSQPHLLRWIILVLLEVLNGLNKVHVVREGQVVFVEDLVWRDEEVFFTGVLRGQVFLQLLAECYNRLSMIDVIFV